MPIGSVKASALLKKHRLISKSMIASCLSSKLSLQRTFFVPRLINKYQAAQFATRADLGKQDLVSIIAEKSNLSQAQSRSALDAFLDTVTNAVARGEKVTIVGFGTFESSERQARVGRNPKTGEELQIAARTVPTFKASKLFKDTVNTSSSS